MTRPPPLLGVITVLGTDTGPGPHARSGAQTSMPPDPNVPQRARCHRTRGAGGTKRILRLGRAPGLDAIGIDTRSVANNDVVGNEIDPEV